jgi:serine protease inhibitor
MESIDSKMLNTKKSLKIIQHPFGNTTVSWNIYIPKEYKIQYKVLAKADNYSDGEENIIPVLTNNILVTESIPLWVRENSKKEYTFENLK